MAKTTSGGWRIASRVSVRGAGRESGIRDWSAELLPADADGWKLVSLELGGETIVAAIETPAAQAEELAAVELDDAFDFAKIPRPAPLQTMGPPSEDFYGEQTPAWAVQRLADVIDARRVSSETLVVWVVDASPSTAGLRREVQGALDLLYAPTEPSADRKPLWSTVTSFATDLQVNLPEPVQGSDEVKSAMRAIVEDDTGREATFAAIGAVAGKWAEFVAARDGNTVVVVVTDEAGDDSSLLESTIQAIRERQAPVYVIGGRAPFGRAMVAGFGPENDGFSRQGGAPTLLQGPESWASEHIRLEFGDGGFGGGMADALDSGFGPCALNRLARQSSGAYFACRIGVSDPSAPGGGSLLRSFSADALARYAPDYCSEEEYRQLLEENGARRALVEAAKLPAAAAPRSLRLDFPMAGAAEIKRMLDDAQKPVAIVEPAIDALYQTLRRGESDRPRLEGPRWQAGFDLAYGRVLAAKVRAEGYNAMLAQLKLSPVFKDSNSNTFLLRPDDSTGAGSAYDRLIKLSRQHLQRAIDEHPGTPWAYLAEIELRTPLGWRWDEARQ